MNLLLVQHGDACAKEIDPDRPLTPQGKDDIDRLGAFLKRAGVRVDRVIHSEKLRAVQTAQRLAKTVAPGVSPEASGAIGPNDDPMAFARTIDVAGGDTLVVGHLPFLARLVSHLVIEDDGKLVAACQPGSAVCLAPGSNGRWQIEWMLRPELLRQVRPCAKP